MYETDKLCFANSFDELLRLRIPPFTLFIYKNRVSIYHTTDDNYVISSYDPKNKKFKITNRIPLNHVEPMAAEIKKGILVERRQYYYSHGSNICVCVPKLMDRTYKWSIGHKDFQYYQYYKKSLPGGKSYWVKSERYNLGNVEMRGGYVFTVALIEGIHNYYINKNFTDIPTNDHYFRQGKYFIHDDHIFYNTSVVGAIKDNKAVLYNKYSRFFNEDFM